MFTKKFLIFDFKLMNKFFAAAVLIIIVLYNILTVITPYGSYGHSNNRFYTLSLNYICDIYLPFFLGLFIIYTFSNDYKYNMHELLLSMSRYKFNSYLVGKLFRIILFYIAIYIITFYCQWYGLNKEIEMSGFHSNILFSRSLFLSIPTSFFIASLAFFLIVMLKKGVYTFLIFFSYIYVESISKGALTKGLQIFINYYGIDYNIKVIVINRMVMLVLGLFLFMLAIRRTSRA